MIIKCLIYFNRFGYKKFSEYDNKIIGYSVSIDGYMWV